LSSPGDKEIEEGKDMRFDFTGEEIKIYDFNYLEAYKIARCMEREGIAFFEQVKTSIAASEIKEVIESLIKEEEAHLAFFQERIEDIQRYLEDGFDEDDLVDHVDTQVFSLFRETNIPEVLSDRRKALLFAILIEKRSVSFYQEILKRTEDETGRRAVQELILQEKKHEEKFKQLLEHKSPS
jgi:rubrerythrin